MAEEHMKRMRYGKFDRLRRRKRLKSFLSAQATRLSASASTKALTISHTAAAAAVGTLTLGANAGNAKVTRIGSRTYTWVTALTEAKATSTYTVAGGGSVIQNADTLTINGKVYTWQTSLTNVDGHVLIGANDTAALLNMKNAINLGTGSGSTYAAATVLNADVDATSSNATTLVIKAKSVGVAGNALTTAESSAGAWGTNTAHLTGGVDAVLNEVKIDGSTASNSIDNLIAAINASGAGTVYSTGTLVNADVTAAAGAGDTMTATSKVTTSAGNQVATSTDVVSASWGDTHLVGGATEAFGPSIASTAHGYSTNDGPFVLGGTRPAGVAATDLFFLTRVDADHVKLSPTLDDLRAGHFSTFADAGTSVTLKSAATTEGLFNRLRTNSAARVRQVTDIDSLA